MSIPDSQNGPLTLEQLRAFWASSAVDDSYAQPFIDAGDGGGLEAYDQEFAQFARVSMAVDVTTQACYVLPWSGQTNPPASGAQNATVNLVFSRTKLQNVPIHLLAGQVFYEEQTTDWGDGGPVTVQTGRRYTLVNDLVIMPGDSGPLTAACIAEGPGYGYNNPLPGTIQLIDQPGSGFNNTSATISGTTGQIAPAQPPPVRSVVLTAANVADMFVPDHVGQLVQITSGPNSGLIAMMNSFIAPNPPNQGSGVTLESILVVENFSNIGLALQPNELVALKNGGTVVGWATFLAARASSTAGHVRIAFILLSGTIASATQFVGQISGVTGTINAPLWTPTIDLTGAAASWRVLDWSADLGLSVTNPQSPEGGTWPMLDGDGDDKNLPRQVGEGDPAYRDRISKIADVVSPNAIKRAIIRAAPELAYCFLEVGTTQFPGFFLDVDAFDYNLLQFNGSMSLFLTPGPLQGQKVAYQNAAGQTFWIGFLAEPPTSILIKVLPNNDLMVPPTPAAGDKIISLMPNNVWTFTITSLVADSSNVANRYKVVLDYSEFRGFFIVGLPALDWGEFGFAYDNYPSGFYDLLPPLLENFYDGDPVIASALYQGIWQAIDKVKAGGVGFDLVLDPYPCPT